jgi:hypothetical protein
LERERNQRFSSPIIRAVIRTKKVAGHSFQRTLGRWKPAPWLRSGGVFLSPAVWRQCFVHDVKHFLKKLSYGTHVIGLRSDPDQLSDVD